jgi:hypothetical protein
VILGRAAMAGFLRANLRRVAGSNQYGAASKISTAGGALVLHPGLSHTPRTHAGYPGRRGLSILSLPSLEYRIARLRMMTVESVERHCERSEAIHRAERKNGLLRRFAPRNDGKYRHTFAISRRDASEVC